jgi:hypothetical protein
MFGGSKTSKPKKSRGSMFLCDWLF